eukprot:CAMPEP_0118950240 /NCGR_PEP_ID=MMETSP1169-20130426/51027_1 /TAXON_ID=36882 /ORGANISM="Pyramimonas obovata, Strain CCMP722" /LENGTH=112 /DNA_ID=CAMNT_0006897029 /DNA_START=146 /DNA_END=480 /DNA_ORIENTATION=-
MIQGPDINSEVTLSEFRKRGLAASKVVTCVIDGEENFALAPVYVSGEGVVKDRKQLEALEVSHIVNATTNVECAFPNDIKYFRVHALDIPVHVNNNEFKGYFSDVANFIDDA